MTGKLLGNRGKYGKSTQKSRIELYKLYRNPDSRMACTGFLEKILTLRHQSKDCHFFLKFCTFYTLRLHSHQKILNQSAALEWCRMTPIAYINGTPQGVHTFSCSCSSRTDHTDSPVNANKQTSREPVKQCPEGLGKVKIGVRTGTATRSRKSLITS